MLMTMADWGLQVRNRALEVSPCVNHNEPQKRVLACPPGMVVAVACRLEFAKATPAMILSIKR